MYKKDKTGKIIETFDEKEAQILKTDILTAQEINGCEISKNEIPQYKDIQIEFIVLLHISSNGII